MPSVPVVAVPASQRSCGFCGGPLEGFLARHVCPSCGKPQELVGTVGLPPGEDYFSALGVSRCFSQDHMELERNFYAVSRILHPDRFTVAGPDAKRISLERMSFLNQAYRTLRDRESLREYVLRLEGFMDREAGGNDAAALGGIPADLAEDWFEIQDLMMEEPENAALKLQEFSRKLSDRRTQGEEKLQSLERKIDEIYFRISGLAERSPGAAGELERIRRSLSEGLAALLAELLREIHAQSYLKSLQNTVQRKIGIKER